MAEKKNKVSTYVYFEVRPSGGYLEETCYHKASSILGRPCLDVALIVNKQLILMDRSVPPAKSLWMAGGRINWERFINPTQYASQTFKEHLGINVPRKSMHILSQRFICLKDRPYPEILTWIIAEVSEKLFRKIKISNKEQSSLLLFKDKKQLISYARKMKLSRQHTRLFTDLWEELEGLNLI